MEPRNVIEALLFASDKPLTLAQIKTALKEAAAVAPKPETEKLASMKEPEIIAELEKLKQFYLEQKSSFVIQELAGGYQLRTRAEYAVWVQQLLSEGTSSRLSQPALETLSIIAYRQPIARADIEAIRGVAVDGVLNTLLERRLIRIAGRSELPGRPLLYETTHQFMEGFCLNNLDDLPNADELRKLKLPASPKPSPSPLHENQVASSTDRPSGPPSA